MRPCLIMGCLIGSFDRRKGLPTPTKPPEKNVSGARKPVYAFDDNPVPDKQQGIVNIITTTLRGAGKLTVFVWIKLCGCSPGITTATCCQSEIVPS